MTDQAMEPEMDRKEESSLEEKGTDQQARPPRAVAEETDRVQRKSILLWGQDDQDGTWHKVRAVTGKPYSQERMCRTVCGQDIQAISRSLIDLPASEKPDGPTCPDCERGHVIRAWLDTKLPAPVAEIPFDAQEWFEQASDREIMELVEIDWGGEPEADRIARFMCRFNTWLESVLRHLGPSWYKQQEAHTCYECHVDEDSALDWLRMRRPSLARWAEQKIFGNLPPDGRLSSGPEKEDNPG
jgi:hypothetical protein